MSATLIVDIGSNSVGAALVSVSKGAAPKLFFATRLPVDTQNGLEQTLESIMKTVAAEHATINGSHIFFSLPWYVSKTDIVKIEHDKPTVITRHTIDKIAKESENKFIAELKSESDREAIDHRLIRTRLNGYDTSNPYDKKAKSLEATFYISIVDKSILDSVRRVVGKYFHIRNSEVSSFSLAMWSSISGILPDERDFLIVDVRGEATDLSLVTEGALMKSLSFPQGKNALAKAVADGSGQSSTAALSLISVAFNGHGESTAQADVLKFTETFKQQWLEAYAKTLQEMSVVPTVFLVADPDVELFFENILNEIKNNGDIHLLKHLDLPKYLESSSVLTDSFLALESIFVTMI